ncbi:PAS domain S-box-containing protein/diguanylate cyclase (GGDEF)-like protein [Thermosipho japonicus]|uniref:PAS domain S-box-containing protein/diguanylate cyclase (GGDEF)-like protein n=1 Tax=Thermosipho japonicus TaxID=90323 RepID=A0A841GK03_9BACT|nr:EAL domain-containing protein [Thermosipho japonicus]MBB6062335.1 PAS domain S-box-containing protein/diguanylate cyclase (GGDEF)-like protein [Thermosipho japonicus]
MEEDNGTFNFFLSAILLVHLYERKLYKISKALVHIYYVLLVLSIFEVLKTKYNFNHFLYTIEDIIAISLLPAVYAFSEDYYGKTKNYIKRFFISLPLFFLILINDFIFKIQLTNSKIAELSIVIYSLFIITLIFRNTIKTNVEKSVKITINIVLFSLFSYYAIIIFINKHNSKFLLLLTMFSFFIVESVLIRKSRIGTIEAAKENLILNISDGLLLVDKNNYVLNLNKPAQKIIGKEFNQIINRKLEDNFKNGQIIENDGKYYSIEIINFEKGAIYYFRDITKEMKYSKRQEIANKLFHNLFNNIPEPLALITPSGKIVDCNSAFTKTFGYKKLENIENIVPDYLKEESKILTLQILKKGYVNYETVRKSKNGKNIFVRIYASKFEIENQTFIYIIYSDISNEKKLSQQLSNLIEKDPLTQTFNKVYVIKRLKSLKPLFYHSLIFIDIKDFRRINSIKGNVFGDKILKIVANKLRKCTNYIISRAHADEFWILAEELDIDVKKAYNKNKELILHINNCLKNIKIDDISLQFHIGTYIFKSNENIDEVIRKASLSLSKSKDEDKIITYSKEIEDEIRKELEKEVQIKKAIEKGEFIPFFQPIATHNMEIVGAEALIRWVKDGKVIPPFEFLDFLEKTGLIEQASKQIFESVCKLLSKTKKLKFVDVNISPIQLKNNNFSKDYLKILEKYNIQSKQITIEITENLFIDYNDIVRENLNLLKSEGFKLCLDDFGTGYSSLNYLRNIPFDIIKIDREFISNIDDEKNLNLLKAIYSIAESFNMGAIPEGVENEKQLEILTMIGFRLFQGYYFGKPMPESEFLSILS